MLHSLRIPNMRKNRICRLNLSSVLGMFLLLASQCCPMPSLRHDAVWDNKALQLPSARGRQQHQSRALHETQHFISTFPRGGGDDDSETATAQEGINPLVVAAPIVAAAICKDGIVLLALHHNVHFNNNRDDDDNDDLLLQDLPVDFAGPFRIQSLDFQGTALLTAGWRADAHYLTATTQSIVKDEIAAVGSSATAARLVAAQMSLLLATCALEGGDTRELNCAALLASVSEGGSLWLVDRTGAYPVRALALGGGSIQVNTLLNDSLRQGDWRGMAAEEGLERLLDLASERMKNVASQRLYGVEAAVVNFSGRRLVRKFLQER